MGRGELGGARRARRDIEERALGFVVRIVRLLKTLDGMRGVPRALKSRLLRAGTSIGANLHEAKGSQSRADFISKCSIAAKESHETLYWLELLVASDLVKRDRLDDLIRECDEIVAILTTIVKRVKQPRA
jgi:four helix bundle protein